MNNSTLPYHSPVSPLLSLVLAPVILTTVAGNLLVILAVKRTPRLQDINGTFIKSLACADLIVGCVIQPLSSIILLTGNWPLGKVECDLLNSVDVLCVTASTLTLCAIAGERYVAITRPLRFKALLNKGINRIIVCVLWTISALISFVPIMSGLHSIADMTHNSSHAKCKNDSRCCDFMLNKTYAVFSSTISFYMPLLVMFLIYSQVYMIGTQQVKMMKQDRQRFRSSNNQQLNQDPSAVEADLSWSHMRRSARHVIQQHRTLVTLGLIMGVFTACWLPFFVVNIREAFSDPERDKEPGNILMGLNWLGYVNSCLNPMIYCHSSEYRAAFLSLLRLLKPNCPCVGQVFEQCGQRCPVLIRPGPRRVNCCSHKNFLYCNRAEPSTNQTPKASL